MNLVLKSQAPTYKSLNEYLTYMLFVSRLFISGRRRKIQFEYVILYPVLYLIDSATQQIKSALSDVTSISFNAVSNLLIIFFNCHIYKHNTILY